MARKMKGGKATKRAGRAARPRPAKRLPSGQYAWKGKARSFSKLPRAEQARIRSGWASKAKRAAPKAGPASKADREWVKRRTSWVERHGKPAQYAGMLPASEVVGKVKGKTLSKIRKAQKAAHVAWVKQGKHGGGNALIIAESIRETLGEELAAIMPQLWWYH